MSAPMVDLLARLPELFAAHLRLSLSALLLGVLVSLPAGVVLHRFSKARSWVLAAVGVVQTVPSLALLAFMVPLIGAVAPVVEMLTGLRPSAIGSGPALLALTVYGVLPILQNTVAALGGLDPAVIEAARGVGMTRRQQLLRVELPLALPVIVAGIRTAAVWTVGTAVLATPVGASSLGDYIFVGLQTRNQASIAVGCAASAVLALVLDRWIWVLQQALEAGCPRRVRALSAGLVALMLATHLPLLREALRPPDARIGAKAFTEAYVMAEIFGLRLDGAGVSSAHLGSLGSTMIFDALRSGDIDLYLDFSGTIFIHVMKAGSVEEDREAVLAKVKAWLLAEHDIRVAASLGYENRYAFAVRRDVATRRGLRSVSDLIGVSEGLSLVAGFEFFDRPEWASVQARYGIRFRERSVMEQALAYEAVRAGERDIVVAYSTDARIEAYDLVLLDDDRGAIPPYEALVLVRGAFAKLYPRAMEALRDLEGAFDEATVRELNRNVDQLGRSPLEVARAWHEDFEKARAALKRSLFPTHRIGQ